MKILITGASGFVGGFLVEEALERGLDVFAAVRKNSPKTYLTDSKIRFIEIDFDDEYELSKIFSKYRFDYIIHGAGLTRGNNHNAYFKVNSGYLSTLVNVLQDYDSVPHKFLFISSLAAYGPADKHPEGIISEHSKPNPVTSYGKSKLAAEQYLKSTSDFPYLILRPTVAYGPRDTALMSLYKCIYYGVDVYAGTKPQYLTFIYIKDLARLLLDAVLSKHSRKAYFVHDGHLYPVQSFNHQVKQLLDKKTVKIQIPISILRGIAFLSEKLAIFSGKYPALNTEKVKELECRRWNCDISGLKLDFDFEARYNLSAGIEETIDWYKKNNWL